MACLASVSLQLYSFLGCNCHGHSTKCHFDHELWEATGQTSGGHCDECQHNTEGYHCERCEPGYFHDPAKDLQDADMCVACDCDPDGTTNGGICDFETHPDKGTVAGKCHCKANVTGPRCDQCKPGYHSLSANNTDGCTKCECNAEGGVLHQDTGSPCDPDTGLCYCKRHVVGDKCDSCMPGTYGLKATDGEGCKACGCDIGGSILENGLFECNHLNGRPVLFVFLYHNVLSKVNVTVGKTSKVVNVAKSAKVVSCQLSPMSSLPTMTMNTIIRR